MFACLGDGAAQSNRRQHVLQGQPVALVIVHVAGGNQRNARFMGELRDPRQSLSVVRSTVELAEQVAAIREQLAITPKLAAELVEIRSGWIVYIQGDAGHESVGILGQILE